MPQSIPSARPASPRDDAPVSAWSLIKPYWISSEAPIAWGLFLASIAINLIVVWINVRLNKWQALFYNALQTKDVKAFLPLLGQFTLYAFAFIFLAVYGRYVRQLLGFRWRQWLTEHFLRDWLGDRAFYRIERDRLSDNPDQRISDDLASFANTTLSLTLDLLATVVTLVSFVLILWTLAGALTIALGGTPLTIPGYMVWAAAIYALVGSYATHLFGQRLVPLNYQQQRVEADFRFGLIRVRENAEQIAFYDGEAAELRNLRDVFMHIRTNWWAIMKYTRRLTFVLSFYGQIAILFPILVAAPRYFAGAYSFGVLMQISDAFGTVSGSFSWFINSYSTLVEWRATVNRLREFKRVARASHRQESASPATGPGGIRRRAVDDAPITASNLSLALPNGDPLATIGDVSIEPGSRWLVRGPSGAGKSTLMRALAGLWPFGEGTIDTPAHAKMMFVPQQNYLPIGTLKAALTYPSAADAFSDDACRDALRASGLTDYANRLDESGYWTRILSPGEQQRLAGARVLLHKPDFLFLDEATSALDPDNEARLYRLFIDHLPKAAIVSVAHRESLAAFHGDVLDVRRADDRAVA